MSSTVVCSYPRSRNSRNAAATSASRIGGRTSAGSVPSPPRGAALLVLMKERSSPARSVALVQPAEGTERTCPCPPAPDTSPRRSHTITSDQLPEESRMPSARPRILYVTDLAYQARGRRYCDEDIHLTSRLREEFDLALCHPRDAAALLDAFDAVVVRNSGPVLATRPPTTPSASAAAERRDARVQPAHRQGGHGRQAVPARPHRRGLPGHPHRSTASRTCTGCPSRTSTSSSSRLGADSAGLRIVLAGQVPEALAATADLLVQPRVDFAYEVSFYFVDHDYQYALHAPHPDRRWQLEPYDATVADLDFASAVHRVERRRPRHPARRRLPRPRR